MYWMVAIRLKISLTKLLMKILVSGWMCNVLDGGDRCVTYGIVEIPVSGWALLCCSVAEVQFSPVLPPFFEDREPN